MMIEPLNLNAWMIALFISISLILEWRQRYYAFMRFLLQRHYGHSTGFAQIKTAQSR